MSIRDSNTLIESLDKITNRNTITQKPESKLTLKDFRDEENNKIIFVSNLDLNSLKLPSEIQLKSKRISKFSHFSQYQNEKNSERNELLGNSNSINSNNIINNMREKYSISNNSKFINSYTSEYNNNNENNPPEEIYKKTKKNVKKEKLYKEYISNRKFDNIPCELNLETKSPNDLNDNKLVIKGYKKNENKNKEKKMNSISINEPRNHSNKNDDNLNNMNTIFSSYTCLFCDKSFNNKNRAYESYFPCGHIFCKKCGKKFYEELIEIMIKNNNFNFPFCPIYDCTKEVSLSLLKILISENNYSLLIKNLSKIYNNNNENEENRETMIINNNKEQKAINIMGTETIYKQENNIILAKTLNKEYLKYLQKNIIDINTNKKYIYFIKKNFIRCPICKEYSLYCKLEGNFDKCLKCMKKYCKFCHKEFLNSHLDVTRADHCKVFYRTYKDFIQQKFYYKYFLNLLYVIGGYLFILTFFILKIRKALKIRNFCIKLIAILFYFFLFIISFPINIIILPYFPMIISI